MANEEKIIQHDTVYIDSIIEVLLKNTRADWKNQLLYSWNWGLGNNYLSPTEMYDLKKYSRVPVDMSPISENPNYDIRAKMYERQKKFLMMTLKNEFIMELYIPNETIGDSRNIVVTNVTPDTRLFGKGIISFQMGKWDSTLR
jgi:hypothetical protein